jgi:hypothetical protein
MGDTRRRKADVESAAEKPAYLSVNPDGIPAELRELKQWVHWRAEWRTEKGGNKGKWSKVPRRRHVPASSTNPATWMRFDFALNGFNELAPDGLGFVFSKDDPFAGVDLDDCRDPATGQLDEWAAAIVATLDSYTEVSPSGTGVKVWVRAKKPPGRNKVKYETGEVEVYDQGRYFAVTGQPVAGTPPTVNERGEQLAAVYRQVFGDQADDKKPGPSQGRRFQGRASDSHGGAGGLSDDDVIRKAGRAKNGDKFKRLWDGDTSGHGGDDSRADLALCMMLAFWCRRDAEQMDRIFRRSGLMRDKWDEPRGESTYGRDTIARAVGNCEQVYEPPVKVKGWPLGGKRKLTAGGPASSNGQHPPPNGQPSQEGQDAQDSMWELMAYGIILRYFRSHYAPAFRRGQVIHSSTLGRDVKMGEACAAPGLALVKLLTEAIDCPRSGQGADIEAIPVLFRTWAKSAWVDMLGELPEEETSGVVVESAEDEFRGRVAAALLHHASLGYRYENDNGEWVTETQRRTLINWCRLFAKSRWADIRGYQVWCRHDEDTGLEVAIRKELFGQVQGCADLARMSATKFTRLAEAYQVGAGGRNGQRIGGARVVLLAPEFLAYLLEHPAADATSDDTGQTHTRAREEDVEMCHGGGEDTGAQGVKRDTSGDASGDTSPLDVQCGNDPPF